MVVAGAPTALRVVAGTPTARLFSCTSCFICR